MIGDLDGSLTARAQLALADRILGIALELLRQAHANDAGLAVAEHFRVAFHHARDHAAAGVTQRTHARFEGGNAWNKIVLRNETDDLVFGVAARRQRGAGAGDRRELDEVATVDCAFSLRPSAFSH